MQESMSTVSKQILYVVTVVYRVTPKNTNKQVNNLCKRINRNIRFSQLRIETMYNGSMNNSCSRTTSLRVASVATLRVVMIY